MKIRRHLFAPPELKKLSLKKPKGLKPHKVKNVTRNVMGEKIGRVHMKKQDFNNMQTRKMKGLKKRNDPEQSTEADVADSEPASKRVKMV